MDLNGFKQIFKGEFLTDSTHKILYSTDASAYKETPLAVAFPKDKEDIKTLVNFCNQNNLSLIPRGAGTSLAGQVVGKGIVVDVSRYMNKIIEVNTEEHWVKVQPGIVLTELNMYLEQYGLFFGPETSSANRCTIGGMVGNNATGLHSLFYGSTRDHLLEVKAILSDGSEATFGPLTKEEFLEKLKSDNLEGQIYRNINLILSNPQNRQIIEKNYPDKSIPRRNTGYALDLLLDNEIFGNSDKKFNFAKLLAGSEGTLAFFTEIKLNLVPLPPKEKAVVCVHFEKLEEAFEANLIALKFKPSAVELMDSTILELTKDNIEQRKNRFFVKGDPGAILIIEFNADTKEEIEERAKQMEQAMLKAGYGYHFPILWNDDTTYAWDLRKAGLGVLSNVPGDAKPVSLVEDTAVAVDKLPRYMKEFDRIMRKYGLSCVYHAHIGSGELHLRPILNLKDEKDRELFRLVARDVAMLVRRYRASLSGEHGDGRLRGEFIPLVLGYEVYKLLKQVKRAWDPKNIFNPGKITDTPPMNTSLRYSTSVEPPQIKTIFDFSATGGYIRTIERCNGSADCRRSQIIGGLMCPSYKATMDEQNSTRARANTLREILTNSQKLNSFDHKEIYEALDLCLSCKGCKAECPSNVDMTKLKAEFLQHYYDAHHVPLRTWLIANLPLLNKLMSVMPGFSNKMTNNKLGKTAMKMLGFAPERDFPELGKTTVNKWYGKHKMPNAKKTIYLFNDEFTNHYDSEIGIKAILLLENLGYKVIIPKHTLSARTYLSKGLVRKAQKIINRNLSLLKDLINDQNPLVGIEPSAILTFRDEAKDLAYPHLRKAAKKIAKNTYTFEEFFAAEIENGNIKAEQFTEEPLHIKMHGHCYQKALSSTEHTKKMLSLPVNYTVEEIESGCCGMAGSFGYEKEHYELSMKIGEMVLFPEVRKASADTVIAAPGTSCRHHIKHGTGRTALHPVEILYEALKR